MSEAKTPKVNKKKQERLEREKKLKAENRARAEMRSRGGVAANILAGARGGERLGGATGPASILGSGTDALFR